MELYLEYKGDLVLTTNGSVQMATGWDETRQYFCRALLTTPSSVSGDGNPIPPDYIFVPAFGVGAGLFVGQNLQAPKVNTQFLSRVHAASAQTPNLSVFNPPVVAIKQAQPHEFVATISLTMENGQVGTVTIGK
jgi:hypothetical protein